MESSGLISELAVTEEFIYYPEKSLPPQGPSTEAMMTAEAAQSQRDMKQAELHSIIEKNHVQNIINSQAYSCYPASCCCIVEEGQLECLTPEVYTCCSRHHEVLRDLQRQVAKRNGNRRLFRKLDNKQERFAWDLNYKEVNVIKDGRRSVSLSASLQKIMY